MRKIILVVLSIVVYGNSFAQLKVVNDGKVGLGTDSPEEQTHVYSPDHTHLKVESRNVNKQAGIKLKTWHNSSSATSGIYMDYFGSTGHHGLNYYSGRGGFESHWFKDYYGNVLMSIVHRYDGKDGVGIGVDIPSYKLHVNGKFMLPVL